MLTLNVNLGMTVQKVEVNHGEIKGFYLIELMIVVVIIRIWRL